MPKAAKTARKKLHRSTINAAEVRQFDSLAAQWWDENGPLKPLHRMNPARLGYLREHICAHFGRDNADYTPFKGLRMLDVGCGGGLVAEPFARLGADVTGIDAAAKNIRAAKAHARAHGLAVNYQATTAEDLATEKKTFDVVTALEIVEHVDDLPLFLSACGRLVGKGGLVIFSTLNRTAKSYLLGIVAAEHVLRWLPVGTHDWKKFVKPSELARPLEEDGFTITDISGLVYNPLTGVFSAGVADVDVNYFLTAKKG
ncbi:MAG: bifunctional 2-polyprenyl-6-hydroxyphenol methylase/3-demethylubiquinol 3-O-methyltransferase UbiG [Alphaproteobacteria bacterium]|nr:bifunctional 2-polyprenyl-6-hydroxyphenol methylase/3-demethylubiquinol 3-O-methyltransferase UbiG [Alphaproteobacteria bacterium]MDE2336363.1 bifunctional 2-polyprenyl-6-hydroxyphenol methylase/3-demethylubiquinol 3-O-methyltransferase UbiG [Alphaproteobacteria bacterium]